MKPTLVIVDDIRGMREMLANGLRGTFDILAEAADGRQAVEAFHQYHPNLMLMDIVMPRMSGLEAMKSIRDSATGIPKIVILSGLTDESIVLKAMEAGASDYLFKPPDLETVRSVLLDVLTPAR